MRCFYCMEEYDEDLDVICPYCGNDVVSPDSDSYCLTAGTVLNQRYMLGRVLGDGGFGITYIGYDKALKRKVAVKEFFPNECVTRQKGETQVSPFSGERGERYEKGLKNFQSEAQRLAKLGSIDGVVNVYDVFDENGTAYIVMEYLSGETVSQMVEGHKFLGFGKTMNIIVSVLKSLRNVHKAGVIHRDISPKNIIKTKEGKIVLIDFGAAKPNTIMMSRTASVVLTQGYAPIEQYDNNLTQGTWTDVYAVAATMYFMLTGVTPDSANSRLVSDTLVPPSELHPGLPDKLDEIIAKALAVRPEDRTQTASELLEQIWSLRSSQNTTRKSKLKKSPDKATTVVNISPAATKIPPKNSAQPKAQWKTYAGGSDKSNDLRPMRPEKSEEKPRIISVVKSVHITKQQPEPQPEQQQPAMPRQKKKIPVPLITAVVIMLLVLGGLVAVGLHDRQNNFEVPEFTGQNYDEVLEQYPELNFAPPEYSYDPDTELDIVVAQSPRPSSRHISKNTEIVLTVNSDQAEVKIPVVGKLNEAAAISTLNSLHLQSKTEEITNDEYDDGTVVSTDPSAGSTIRVNEVVTLYVARNRVSVPKVIGQSLEQASEMLTNAGLKIGSEPAYEYSEEYDTGLVIAQSISADTKMEKNTTVNVTISKGTPPLVTLSAEIDVSELSAPLKLRVYLDGEQEGDDISRYYIGPGFNHPSEISITRKVTEGVKTVTVYVVSRKGEQLYQTWSFDFTNSTVALIDQSEIETDKSSDTDSDKSTSSSESSRTSSSEAVSEPETSSRDSSETESSESSDSDSSAVMFPQQPD